MLIFVAIKAVLFVGGLVWCKEVFERRHEDLETLREGDDRMHSALIMGFWIVTLLIALAVSWMLMDAVRDIVRGVRGL